MGSPAATRKWVMLLHPNSPRAIYYREHPDNLSAPAPEEATTGDEDTDEESGAKRKRRGKAGWMVDTSNTPDTGVNF